MKKISKRNAIFCVMMTLMLVLIAVVCVTTSTAKAVEEIEENLNVDKAWVIDNFGEDVWNDIEEDLVRLDGIYDDESWLEYEATNDIPGTKGVFVAYLSRATGIVVARVHD